MVVFSNKIESGKLAQSFGGYHLADTPGSRKSSLFYMMVTHQTHATTWTQRKMKNTSLRSSKIPLIEDLILSRAIIPPSLSTLTILAHLNTLSYG